jgi:adenylate cyclase
MIDSGTEVFTFSGFSLDPRQRLLFGPDGRSRSLSGRAFDTLLYLVEHPNQFIDKQALMRAVWPKVVVEENNLNQNISIVRRVLGEGPGEHRFIATVPGRGFRFVANVAVSRESSTSQQAAEPGREWEVLPAISHGTPAAIAVLPFVNLTGEPGKECFCDGIAEELIHTLTRLRELKVASRTSSFAYKGHNADIRQIARDLGVDAVIEGNVRGAGERIRVAAQLIDARTGYHLWSRSYDRTLDGLFAVQDELTVAIVDALRISLTDATRASLIESHPTRDLVAYQLYLQAKFAYGRPSTPSALRAIDLLEQAVARDPQFALASAAAASIRFHLIYFGIAVAENLNKCEREIEHALGLQPDLALAHAARGMLLAMRGKRVQADEEFHAARLLDECEPRIRLMRAMEVLAPAGHLQIALQELLECHRLAPAYPPGTLNLALTYHLLDDEINAAKFCDMTVKLGLPRQMEPVADLTAALAARAGRHAEAATVVIEVLPVALLEIGAAEVVGQVYAAQEDGSKRSAAATRLVEFGGRLKPSELNPSNQNRMLLWYVMVGALDSAYDWANACLDHIEREGTAGHWASVWRREMESFRRDPRFHAFASRLGLTEYWKVHGQPDEWVA